MSFEGCSPTHPQVLSLEDVHSLGHTCQPCPNSVLSDSGPVNKLASLWVFYFTYGGYYGLVVVTPRPQTFHRSHDNLKSPYRIASIFYM